MRTIIGLAIAVACVAAASASRVLVLLESEDQKSTHSQFLDLFSSKHGYETDIRIVGDKSLKLKNFDDWFYDHMVILAPRAKGASASRAIPWHRHNTH